MVPNRRGPVLVRVLRDGQAGRPADAVRPERPWPRRSGTRCPSGRSRGDVLGRRQVPRLRVTVAVLALVLSVALVVTAAALMASTSQARKMQWFVCGQNGVKIRTAPWTMGIADKIGVRIKHGTRYILRAGSAGPSCAVARKKARAYRETPNTKSNPCRLVWRPSLRRRPTRPKHSLGTPTRCLGRLLVGAKPADRALLLLGAGLQLGSDREARLVALLKGVRSNDRESGSLFHRLQVSHPAELRKPFAEQPYSSGRTSEHRRFRPNLGGRPDLSRRTGLAEGLSVSPTAKASWRRG